MHMCGNLANFLGKNNSNPVNAPREIGGTGHEKLYIPIRSVLVLARGSASLLLSIPRSQVVSWTKLD